MKAITGHLYVHYKDSSKQYMVICDDAIDESTGKHKVLYRALYQTEKYPLNTVWVRDKDMFEGKVLIPGEETNSYSLNSKRVFKTINDYTTDRFVDITKS